MHSIRWVPSQDTCSEIRRKVHRSRLDRGILSGAGGPVVALGSEFEIVAEFLLEEFGALTATGYRESVDPEHLPDVKSWLYPGEWITPFFAELTDHFVRDMRGFLFSSSGSFTLTLYKNSLGE
jgi:hypothetical protein